MDGTVTFLLTVALLVAAVGLSVGLSKRRANYGGSVIACAVIAALFVVVALVVQHFDHHVTTQRDQARTQIERRYAPIKIDSISLRAEPDTITYEKGGKICSTILISRGKDHLIATIGAQCALIPR